MPELWFIPISYQIISGLSYAAFLAGQPAKYAQIAAIINLITVVWLLWKQFTLTKEQWIGAPHADGGADHALPVP
jgi:hypothetical protein